MELTKIAFGGGCHWCTEAVFQSLKGVKNVAQGFIASKNKNATFSEAVIVAFDAAKIDLKILIEIHLLTHKSTSKHSFRNKYRSAIYFFNTNQQKKVIQILDELQSNFNEKIITKIIELKKFKPSSEQFQNYYQKNPNKPFCEKYIHPKLALLTREFSKNLK
ncbi:peptide-methionine (S)-S-oxide reductase [uncultured Polaribacter sp.]|uniref:peptide-methionine (S)-S-oxide reductase n=1 Tax=uncultured Polaribacter sp. TaxID=174711 RepID=UPI0026213409|nr:peptide-methionine (S)-S-oxide reductase [uncultured Polaribacter sp.]